MYSFIYYLVQDVMTVNVVSVEKHISVKEAEAIFAKHDFNGIPVVEGARRLIGIVTKLDILKAFTFTEKTKVPPYEMIMEEEISQVMTRDLITVEPDIPLTRVVNRMILTRHKSFPVVEENRLVGMIAREDVLKALRMAAQGIMPTRVA